MAAAKSQPDETLSPYERLKLYTDLCKSYSEIPAKMLGGYSVGVAAISITANVARDASVIHWLSGVVVAIAILIGVALARFDNTKVEAVGSEIESLTRELGLTIIPSFPATRLLFRGSVVLFVLIPLAVALLVFDSPLGE
jgi:hypothetical protein